jgi:hypothetical protein
MFDIHQECIETELKKVNNLIPIKIKNAFGVTLTVWVQKYLNTGFWAKDISGNDIKIFPSRSIQILKIGGRIVQSIKSYKEEREIYFEVMKSNKKFIYKQAFTHSKQLN